MRRCLAILAVVGTLLPGCTPVERPNPYAIKSPEMSGPQTPGAPSPPPGKLGQPEVPGSWPDRPQTPKTAAPGVVSPPPAPGAPVSPSEGP